MEERWDPERNDPEVVALLEAFLVNTVWGQGTGFLGEIFIFLPVVASNRNPLAQKIT